MWVNVNIPLQRLVWRWFGWMCATERWSRAGVVRTFLSFAHFSGYLVRTFLSFAHFSPSHIFLLRTFSLVRTILSFAHFSRSHISLMRSFFLVRTFLSFVFLSFAHFSSAHIGVVRTFPHLVLSPTAHFCRFHVWFYFAPAFPFLLSYLILLSIIHISLQNHSFSSKILSLFYQRFFH